MTSVPKMADKTYALILCGGSGSRLWPRSRSAHPKHLLQLNGGATLIQETVKRIDLPLERIFCITEASHAALLKKQLPKIPADNIIIEPDRRGTASVVALAILTLKARGVPGEAVVLSLHADSLIQETEEFRRTTKAWVAGIRAADRIINLGIRPTYPSTGLGYINFGEKLTEAAGFDVFATEQFVEKPNESTAKVYVESGRYLWNTGMFGGLFATLERELRTHMPQWMKILESALQEKAASGASVSGRYLKLPNEAIDTALLEKSDNLAVIPASFGWADVGSWADLHDVLERDPDGNLFEGEYVDIDSHNCFVYSPDKLVATIGLSNLVIIHTSDAVLVCPKDRAQDVKKVVEELKARGRTKYL
jgi:mannose-1-phosphate guanylyltransferase